MSTNPLLDFNGLPRFATIRTEHITPAVEALLTENRALIKRLTATSVAATWEGFVAPLEDANERLGRAWGVVGHLHGVLDSPELREAYNANQPGIVQYWTELGQNLALFEKYKALRASTEFASLKGQQQKIIDNEIRDFRLSGAELSEEKKQRYAQIMDELARLSTKFSENVLDATNAFSTTVQDLADVAGIPEDSLELAAEAAQKAGAKGWKFTLHSPSYMPVMQYADNRDLRARIYRAHVTRASEFGKPDWDNTPLIAQILKLRNEAAQLLGYSSHAKVSLATKMAESPRQVVDFLEDLAAKAKPFALKDWDELNAFAANELGIAQMQAWDSSYASEKLRLRRYDFSDQEVKQYFPEPKVMQGMFRVIETIYGLHIESEQAEAWDPNVRFYRISEKDGTVIGRFYVDLYARETKRGGAWMDEAITRRLVGATVQTPVAYLNCNFPSPAGDKPATFSHDDVITLFHEFGHGLHHMLTRVDYLGVSGIRGVEWDAVELPSQFMENFCWEWDVLSHMTAHVDTGAPLPRALFDKMVAAKNFQSGMQMVRQVEFSLFDMLLHDEFDPESGKTAQHLLDEIRSKVAVSVPPVWNRFPNNFSHIFSGGYSAGYYSYKWAEVLSADAYSAFEESGVLDPGTGARFREEILAVGGSRPAIESFKAFRGREPTADALMRHSGMISA